MTMFMKFFFPQTRVLLEFLDASGDGQIEAYELEAALRRLRKDFQVRLSPRAPAFVMLPAASQSLKAQVEERKSNPKSSNTSTTESSLPQLSVDFASSSSKRQGKRKNARSKIKVFSGSMMDSTWLESFDTRIGSHVDRAFSRV